MNWAREAAADEPAREKTLDATGIFAECSDSPLALEAAQNRPLNLGWVRLVAALTASQEADERGSLPVQGSVRALEQGITCGAAAHIDHTGSGETSEQDEERREQHQ